MNRLNINIEETADNIRYLMEFNKLTPKKISIELGISTTLVYKWLDGQRLPSVDMLLNLSELFNVRMDSIIIFDEVER